MWIGLRVLSDGEPTVKLLPSVLARTHSVWHGKASNRTESRRVVSNAACVGWKMKLSRISGPIIDWVPIARQGASHTV